MEVTYKTVGEVIAEHYTHRPVVEEDFVGFGLQDEDYTIEVVITLYEVTPETEEDPLRQAMQIIMWFCDNDNGRLNFNHIPLVDLLELCWRLQENIDWGVITPRRVDEKTVELCLFRCIDITMRDLSLAFNGDMNSEFLRTLERMRTECDELSPMFLALANGDVSSLSEAELFLTEPAGHS